eukprot:jgi/Ulvmu1/1664/UM114_0035.1
MFSSAKHRSCSRAVNMQSKMIQSTRATIRVRGARVQRSTVVVPHAKKVEVAEVSKPESKEDKKENSPKWWQKWKSAVETDSAMVPVDEADTEKETELPAKAAEAATEAAPPPAPEYYSTADPRLSGDEVKEVLGLFETWNAALASGEPSNVADLYADDGVLLPTVSNSVRCDRKGLEDYFTNFLKLQPQGVINEYGIRQEATDADGMSSVISNSGIYTFTFGVDGTVVQARFTYVYKRVGDSWKILSHHSSQLPTKLTPSPFTGKKYLSKNTTDSGLTAPEVEGVLAAFQKWNNALKTLNPENVIDLYAPDAILLPTVADDVRTTKEERRKYFIDFLKNQPEGELDEYHIRLIGRDGLGLPCAVSNQGIYTFELKASGKKVQARYTYNYVREGDRWLIKKHHSSAMPEATKKA